MRNHNYKALGGVLALMLAVLAILFLPFMIMGRAHAISCGDTITTCLDNLIVSGAARITSETVTTLTVTDLRATTTTNAGGVTGSTFVPTITAVTLTSPTATFDASNKWYMTLASNAAITGVRPINGVTGQVLVIRATGASGTARFDDNVSTMALGGNITLT